jgi:hypothetical protein
MPQITVSKTDLNAILIEARNKVEGVSSLRTPMNQEQIAKAVFTIAGQAFIRKTNSVAAVNPKSFHHIYEWNSVGSESQRLFRLVRSSVRSGRLMISSEFTDSKKSVPVDPRLKVSRNGSRSVKGNHVFRKKASVMESGRAIRISAKASKSLVFPNRNGTGLVFTKSVVINNPGGKAVKNSFSRHMRSWFSNPANISLAVSSSGFNRALEKELSSALNQKGAGMVVANNVIRSVSTKYSQGRTIL